MTKEEKLQKVCEKIYNAKNQLRTKYYFKNKLERENVEILDLYNPIFFKYNEDLMKQGGVMSMSFFKTRDDNEWALGYRVNKGGNEVCKMEILAPDQISEDMLDEMLAVKDCGEVVQARMTNKSMEYLYEDYLAKKNEEIAKEKRVTKVKTRQDKWNDFNFVLSLIALGVSLIVLIIKFVC